MRQNVRPIRIIHHVYNIRRLLECRPLHRFLLGTISFGLYVWQAMMQSSCDKERERRKRSPRTRSSQGWAAFRILLWSPCPTATIKTTIATMSISLLAPLKCTEVCACVMRSIDVILCLQGALPGVTLDGQCSL